MHSTWLTYISKDFFSLFCLTHCLASNPITITVVRAWSNCHPDFENLCQVKPLHPSGLCGKPQNIFPYFGWKFSTFILSAISVFAGLPAYSFLFFTRNMDKFGVSFNLLIRCCCDSGYPRRMKIDWLLWCICENPNSPISISDVMTLEPGAEAAERIREAHCNSTHTLQLVNMAQTLSTESTYDPLVFLNSIKLNSLRSYVLNSDSSHFNQLIVPAPFNEDLGSFIYKNNWPSSV